MADWLMDKSLAPDPEGHLEPFYDSAHRGELALPYCSECDLPLELEQLRCDQCGSDCLAWKAVELKGCVYSATLVHRLERGLVKVDGPYPVLDVELTSGHRLLMTTASPSSWDPAIGDPVAIGFRDVGGIAIPAVKRIFPK